MSQPDRPFPPDDLPATQNLSPSPAKQSAASTAPEEILATLPVGLSRTVAMHSGGGNGVRHTGPRYSRKDLHARGGLGEVYLAQDEELPREVALKEIRPDRDDEHSRLRFVIEGTITGSLEHPGIVPVYSLGRHDDGRPFYAMRFIRGKTLQQSIAEMQPADFASAAFRQLLQKFVTVCQTLQYTHDRGVIHRDLKPANIMVGDYGETLVVDWGLAKFIGQLDVAAPAGMPSGTTSSDSSATPAETEQGVVLGTPAYMSPEQAFGRIAQLTAATDIYALGATLYHLLTGQSPLKQSGKYKNALERVQEGDIAAPRSISSKIPRALEAVCLKAMSLRPADRYANARDLAADLERWLANEPLAVYREPIHIRANRWLRKHPAIAATGVTSLALILVAAVVISAISSTYSQQLAFAYNKLNLQHGELAFANKQLTASHQQLNAANGELVQVNADLKVARDEAKENEKEALDREKETQSVLDFVLKHIVAAARPEGEEAGLGRNILLRDAIQGAAPFVATSFQDQPTVQIRLHRTLGDSFRMLGNYSAAREEFQEVQKLLKDRPDKTKVQLLEAANSIAVSFSDEGNLAKGRELLEANLAECKRELGEKHPLTLDSMHNLAVVYEDLNLKDKAFALRKTVYEERKQALGPKHHDTLKSMNNLAYSLLDAGQVAEAIKLAEDTLKLKREVLGPSHHDTLGSVQTLSVIYSAAGRSDEALKMREQLLQEMTETLGPEHANTLGVMQNLANSYFAAGRHNDAVLLYENASARLVGKFGKDHPATISAQFALATLYGELGRSKLAVPLFEDVLKRSRRILGPHHPTTINCMRNLANEYSAQNREQLALELRIEAFIRARDSLGREHPETLSREYDLAQQYHHLEVYPTALAMREQIYQGRKSTLGEDDPETLDSMNMLARTHLALRQSADAIELLTQLKLLREKRVKSQPEDATNACYLAYTVGQLGEAQQLKGDDEAAAKTLEECVILFGTTPKPPGTMARYFEQLQRFYGFKHAACQKLAEAVRDAAFAEKQPPGEVRLLLEGQFHHHRRMNALDEAVATAEAYERQIKRGITTNYEAAVMWSLVADLAKDAAKRDQYAQRAIELLAAVKPGPRAYFNSAEAQSYALHFRPDFAVLRDRADFKALLEKLPKMSQDLIWRDEQR